LSKASSNIAPQSNTALTTPHTLTDDEYKDFLIFKKQKAELKQKNIVVVKSEQSFVMKSEQSKETNEKTKKRSKMRGKKLSNLNDKKGAETHVISDRKMYEDCVMGCVMLGHRYPPKRSILLNNVIRYYLAKGGSRLNNGIDISVTEKNVKISICQWRYKVNNALRAKAKEKKEEKEISEEEVEKLTKDIFGIDFELEDWLKNEDSIGGEDFANGFQALRDWVAEMFSRFSKEQAVDCKATQKNSKFFSKSYEETESITKDLQLFGFPLNPMKQRWTDEEIVVALNKAATIGVCVSDVSE